MHGRLVVVVAMLAACSRKPGAGVADAAEPVDAGPPAAPSVAPDDRDRALTQATMDAPTLKEALRAAQPFFTEEDVAPSSVSKGALSVGYWAALKMKWTDVSAAKDETSWAMAQKDVDDARGKKVCPIGAVGNIKAMKGARETKFFIGFVDTADGSFQVVAVGSTGALVQGSRARFCGVVTGLSELTLEQRMYRYVSLVGLFDLSENRAR